MSWKVYKEREVSIAYYSVRLFGAIFKGELYFLTRYLFQLFMHVRSNNR